VIDFFSLFIFLSIHQVCSGQKGLRQREFMARFVLNSRPLAAGSLVSTVSASRKLTGLDHSRTWSSMTRVAHLRLSQRTQRLVRLVHYRLGLVSECGEWSQIFLNVSELKLCTCASRARERQVLRQVMRAPSLGSTAAHQQVIRFRLRGPGFPRNLLELQILLNSPRATPKKFTAASLWPQA
jgi:hypothetical protein